LKKVSGGACKFKIVKSILLGGERQRAAAGRVSFPAQKRFAYFQTKGTSKEFASDFGSPRFARRLFCTEFWGQKRIGGFAKYGSRRCFSEMLSFRKDFLIQ
jgi:hypothetical protein